MAIITNPKSTQGTCFAIYGRDIIVRTDDDSLTFNDLDVIKNACGTYDMFEERENGICVLGVSEIDDLPSQYRTMMIRQYMFEREESMVRKVCRAKALIEWRRNTKYCGRCGNKLVEHAILTACECPACKNLIFPRIEPCIIVLVKKEDKMLLLKHVQRNSDVYACLAGFVEAGETAEQAVVREIKEETGLTVKNIKYFGSQSWPFPSQFMLAFTAEYASGDIVLQEDEIAEAKWFDRLELPSVPPPGSIAYQLIMKS